MQKTCSSCCATGGGCAQLSGQDPLVQVPCSSTCGVPAFSSDFWQSHQANRKDFLQVNGPDSASLFDNVYGYAATGGCGKNINYYGQFDAADASHCNQQKNLNPVIAIDFYRGLKTWNQLRGWDTRHTRVLQNCCEQKCLCGTSLVQSCNGNLPYPYAQPINRNQPQKPTLRFWLM